MGLRREITRRVILDESRLTCSFDHKEVHFTVINTDTYNKMGSFPIHWVTSDIENASQNPAIKHIFVINHRPVYGSGFSAEPPTADSNNAVLWQVMENNHCVAMISSHEHLFFKKQVNNKVWQVITGCAGARLDPVPDSLQYFGYTIFQVMSSGKIIEKTMGRDVPAGGYLKKPDQPTI
ncbi:MAG: hypothetical protein V1733_00500 [bacterium]